MTFLTRSSSAGPEDRAGLNPDLIVRTTSSARASPMPFAQVSPLTHVFHSTLESGDRLITSPEKHFFIA